jgi:hypothetical protein
MDVMDYRAQAQALALVFIALAFAVVTVRRAARDRSTRHTKRRS